MPLLTKKTLVDGPIFPYTFYHLTHDWFVAADIPVHYADAIRYNVQRLPQGFSAVNLSGALLMEWSPPISCATVGR
jgi:hypothetical protein